MLRSGISHQFLWTVSQPIQFCDKGAVRLGATRNRVQAESGPRPVSGLALMQLPRGLRLLLHDQYAATCSGGVAPSTRPSRRNQLGTQETRRGVERRGMATTRQPSELGAALKGVTQLQVERSLRVKRSDPSHGANAQPQAVAVPVVKVPVRILPCRRASTRPASEPSADGHRTGRRGLTR